MPLGAARITLLAFSPTVQAAAEVIRRKVGVSAVGNAQVDTAQSQFGGASAVFDGTGDYLQMAPDNTFAVGTGDITIDFWFKSNNTSTASCIIDLRPGSNGFWPAIFLPITTQGMFLWWNGGRQLTHQTALSDNNWHHAALVRDNGDWTIYLDGVGSTASYNSTGSIDSSSYARIGANFNLSNYANAHIEELRISNTARYTTTFTPSTTPFVNDANTLLLLHMDGTDGSTLFEDDNSIGWQLDNLVYTGRSFNVGSQDSLPRAIAISNDGTRLILAGTAGDSIYSYTLSTPWDISTATYDSVSISASQSVPSGLTFSLDGTKMFVSGANPTALDAWNLSTAWDISTASATSAYDFSPEMTYCNDIRFDLNGDKMFLLAGTSGTNAHKVHQYSLSTAYNTTTETYDSIVLDHSSQTTSALSFAFSYDGKKLFIVSTDENIYEYSLPTAYNLSGASYTTSYDISSENTNSFGIAYNLIGTRIYILDEPSDTIYQYSVAPRAEVSVSAVGNAQVDTAQSQFGGASAYFDGTADYLDLSSQSIALEGDWTFETWVNSDVIGSSDVILRIQTVADAFIGSLYLTNGKIAAYIGGGGTSGTTVMSADTWYHVAWCRDNGTIRMYINGVQDATRSYATDQSATNLYIGHYPGDANTRFNGWLDESRLSNTARYPNGTSFTPSTTPFVNDANTLLLLHMDGTDASTTFLDDNGVY